MRAAEKKEASGETHPRHLLGIALALSASGCHVLLQLCLQMRGVLPHLDTQMHMSEAESQPAGNRVMGDRWLALR